MADLHMATISDGLAEKPHCKFILGVGLELPVSCDAMLTYPKQVACRQRRQPGSIWRPQKLL
jgi:hypothetical protein